MKVSIKNQQRLVKINRQRISNILTRSLRLLGLSRAELSILLVNDRRMRILNHTYRGIDRTTDVLSFPQNEYITPPPLADGRRKPIPLTSDIVLGDIVINLHKTVRQAEEYGVPFNDELKRLLIHGLLHLTGYDHEKGGYQERKMREKAKYIFDKL
jgi:probable rRNA maturation factor